MDLTTLDRVKVGIEKVAATDDAALQLLITAVSAQTEQWLNRLAYKTSRTVYYDSMGGPFVVVLPGYGDSASAITSFSYDTERVWGTDTVVDATDYTFDTNTGIFRTDDEYEEDARVFKLVYVGGMATTTALFVAAYPDIAGAVDRWVVAKWQSRGHVGISSVSFEGGSIAIGTDEMPKEIEGALRKHRRSAYVR